MTNHVCPECNMIVSRTFGHAKDCSIPTRNDPPARLPENSSLEHPGPVALTKARHYTSGKPNVPDNTRRAAMAPRGKAAVKEEPQAEEETEFDYTVYADKPITQTMEDFHEWLQDVVGVELDLRSVALGGTLRMHFQQSDFNKERRAERQAARAASAASNGEAGETPAEAPAKRGRPAAAKPAAAAAPAKPAARRGRPPKASATAEAPF